MNVVELSGLARTAVDWKKGCVAMPISRQRQLLEEGHGLTGPVPVETPSKSDITICATGRRCAPSLARKQYIRLRETLFIGEGPKTFDITGETLSQANVTAFRNPLCRELTAFLNQDDLSPLVESLSAFALHMTTDGTRNKKEPAWSTVYGYITSFGSELVELACDMDFPNLEAEEYLDLYQDIVDRKASSLRRALATRELLDFHVYLQKYHDFAVVDFSDIEGVGSRPDFQVDAEVIQPQEYALGLAQLSARASISNEGDGTDADRRRLYRQAEIFSLLMRPSGARHNELAALRFKDILATPDVVVLLIRPSRYRRLKTSAARRIVDISSGLTHRQRRVIFEWVVAEKNRLSASWKPTLPLFGKKDAPHERVASGDLRDLALQALDAPVGYRTKVHRARHLVAGEDLLAMWFSDEDWRVLRCDRARARRSVRGRHRTAVVLPRQSRQHSIRFGHSRSSTTLANYFHIPWATVSRPHHALQMYVDRHSAAVALGVSVVNADKILQRAKPSQHRTSLRVQPLAAWLSHVAGVPAKTPGMPFVLPTKQASANAIRVSARVVERVLRDIQRGLPPNEASLVHGLDVWQLRRLQQAVTEVEIKVGFKVWPSTQIRSKPRSARFFQDARPLEGILELLDDGVDYDRQLILSLSQTYMIWAQKGHRNILLWPDQEAERLVVLLAKLGIPAARVTYSSLPGREGLVSVKILRSQDRKKTMNHALAWLLIVARVAGRANEL